MAGRGLGTGVVDAASRAGALLKEKLYAMFWFKIRYSKLFPKEGGIGAMLDRKSTQILKSERGLAIRALPNFGADEPVPTLVGPSFDEADEMVRLVASRALLGHPAAKLSCVLEIGTVRQEGWVLSMYSSELRSYLLFHHDPPGSTNASQRVGFRLKLVQIERAVVHDAELRLRLAAPLKPTRGAYSAGCETDLSIFRDVTAPHSARAHVRITVDERSESQLQARWNEVVQYWRGRGHEHLAATQTLEFDPTATFVQADVLAHTLRIKARKDRYLTQPLQSMAPSEIFSTVGELKEVVEGWVAGRSSPRLFCQLCKRQLYLRRVAPIPMWCCTETKEPHYHCSEKHVWKGVMGYVSEQCEDEIDEEEAAFGDFEDTEKVGGGGDDDDDVDVDVE